MIDVNNGLGIVLEDKTRSLIIKNLSHVVHNGVYSCFIRLSTTNQLVESKPLVLFAKCNT